MNRKKKFIIGLIGISALLLGGVSYYYSFTKWIPAGYIGVVYNAQSGLSPKIITPRAITLGYLQQLYIYPTKIQNAVYSQDPTAGEVRAADGISVTTSDNANTTFDFSIIYRIRPEDVFILFKSFGPIPIETIQTQYIRRAVKDGASAIGSQYELFSLMGPKREEASERLTDELRSRLAQNGITVERAMILTPYPADSTAKKIAQRVGASIQLDIARINAQIAEINRQTSVITAEAQQQAQVIAASGVSGKAAAVIDLDNVDLAIKQWNGHLPPYSKDSKVTIIAGDNSPNAKTVAKTRPRPTSGEQQ